MFASRILHVLHGIKIRFVPLMKAIAPWFVLAVVGHGLTGGVETSAVQSGAMPLDKMLGSIIALLAAFMGWYGAHRCIYHGVQGGDFIPGPRQAKFIWAQLLNLLGMIVVAIGVLLPLAIAAAVSMPDLPEADIQRFANRIAMLAFPIMLILFSRLLLMAPLMIRDLPKPFTTSCNLTKGHVLELTLLQILSLAPLLITQPLAGMLSGVSLWGAVIITEIGGFASILLYTQLAEDEYTRLVAKRE